MARPSPWASAAGAQFTLGAVLSEWRHKCKVPSLITLWAGLLLNNTCFCPEHPASKLSVQDYWYFKVHAPAHLFIHTHKYCLSYRENSLDRHHCPAELLPLVTARWAGCWARSCQLHNQSSAIGFKKTKNQEPVLQTMNGLIPEMSKTCLPSEVCRDTSSFLWLRRTIGLAAALAHPPELTDRYVSETTTSCIVWSKGKVHFAVSLPLKAFSFFWLLHPFFFTKQQAKELPAGKYFSKQHIPSSDCDTIIPYWCSTLVLVSQARLVTARRAASSRKSWNAENLPWQVGSGCRSWCWGGRSRRLCRVVIAGHSAHPIPNTHAVQLPGEPTQSISATNKCCTHAWAAGTDVFHKHLGHWEQE